MVFGLLVLVFLVYVALRTRPDIRSAPKPMRGNVIERLFGAPRSRVIDVLGAAWLVFTPEGMVYLGAFNSWLGLTPQGGVTLNVYFTNVAAAGRAQTEDTSMERGHALKAAGDWRAAARAYDACAKSATDEETRLDALECAAKVLAASPEVESASQGVARLLALVSQGATNRSARLCTIVSEHPAATPHQKIQALRELRDFRAMEHGAHSATVLQIDSALGAAYATSGEYSEAAKVLTSAAWNPAAVRPAHYFVQAATCAAAASPTRVTPDLASIAEVLSVRAPHSTAEREYVDAIISAVSSGRSGNLHAARKRLPSMPAWMSSAFKSLASHLDNDEIL